MNKCEATTPAINTLINQLSNPVQQICSNPNIENVPNKSADLESSTKHNVNIGRSLLEELLRSGEVKRNSASKEIEQCKSSEKTPDQRYDELITAFNVIVEEISRQKKESKVPVDIPSILNQMAPRIKTTAKKRPIHRICTKKADPKSFSRDKVLDQSLLRSIEKLDSQLMKFVDKLKQVDYERNDNDDYLTYDDDDVEPIIITPNDFDYVSDESDLNVSTGNVMR